MDAREAAIRGGMNQATWDKTVKRMLIKALIQRRTIGTAKGKIVYENTTDQQKAKEFSLKNGVKLKDIKKTKVKPRNSRDEQEMFIAPQKELDGMGMVDDLEEYGKTLEEYFGEDAATESQTIVIGTSLSIAFAFIIVASAMLKTSSVQ